MIADVLVEPQIQSTMEVHPDKVNKNNALTGMYLLYVTIVLVLFWSACPNCQYVLLTTEATSRMWG